MINEICIENIGVIAKTSFKPAPGITVITGETGAGKTMVLTSFAMILGQKVPVQRVRDKQETATVQAELLLPRHCLAVQQALEAGAQIDELETADNITTAEVYLLVNRSLARQGRSKAYLGGRAVPIGVLQDCLQDVLTVHGQGQQMRLISAKAQIQALDEAGGEQAQKILITYQQQWQCWVEAKAEIAQWKEKMVAAVQRKQYIQVIVQKAETAAVEVGEETKLIQALQEAEKISQNQQQYQNILALLDDENEGQSLGIIAGLQLISEQIIRLPQEKITEQISDFSTQIVMLLKDILHELHSKTMTSENIEKQIDKIHTRRAMLKQISRELLLEIDEIPAAYQQAKLEIESLQDPAKTLEVYDQKVKVEYKKLQEYADALSTYRQTIATRLAALITEELMELGFSSPEFAINCQLEDQINKWGQDKIEFLFRARQSAEIMPVAKTASGGEISRIMLALEVSIAELKKQTSQTQGNEANQTFVFDEIDAGIGGTTAHHIGLRLAKISRQAQVIVVTHLAQVAAYADKHYVVSPSEDTAFLEEVAGEKREIEIARMLSGQTDSQVARRHAEELLVTANSQICGNIEA